MSCGRRATTSSRRAARPACDQSAERALIRLAVDRAQLSDVRSRGRTGKHLLSSRFSRSDPNVPLGRGETSGIPPFLTVPHVTQDFVEMWYPHVGGRHMRRRDFIAGLSVAAAWPLTAMTQQAGSPRSKMTPPKAVASRSSAASGFLERESMPKVTGNSPPRRRVVSVPCTAHPCTVLDHPNGAMTIQTIRARGDVKLREVLGGTLPGLRLSSCVAKTVNAR
jgi:hypothetical protein